MTKPTLLVLAAGMGSRYGGLKQIEPVGPDGETIIDFSVFDALRVGLGRLVFVIRPDIEAQFKELVGSRFEKKIPVTYVFQELNQLPPGFAVPPGRTKPWGTGHAILAAADVIREPFAVINADDFYGPNSLRLLANHLRSSANDYAMVGHVLRNTLSDFGTVSRGVCQTDNDGYLKNVTELTKIERRGGASVPASRIYCADSISPLTGDEIVSLNLWGFTPGFFAHLRAQFAEFLKTGCDQTAEFYLPAAVNSLIASKQERCRVLPTPDSWLGVTYREDRPAVAAGISRLIESGVYPRPLWPEI
jgi:UTP-glucose-1-phosphate uridylyltransferase